MILSYQEFDLHVFFSLCVFFLFVFFFFACLVFEML